MPKCPLTKKPDQKPVAKPGVPLPSVPKGRQSLSKVRRELSDEELTSPAVQKMLIEEVERLELECAELDLEGIVAKRKADPYSSEAVRFQVKNPA